MFCPKYRQKEITITNRAIKNEKPFYSIEVHYQGTDMKENNHIIKVNRTLRYDYTPYGEDYYTK